MRNREQIYGQEAAELLRNITVYHCMRRDQLLRLYPGKEGVIENLLRYLVKQQRIFYNTDRDCYGDVPDCREDRELTAALWVLLDFIEKVEYHSPDNMPAKLVFFADGEVYEVVYVGPGKEALLQHALAAEDDSGQRLVNLIRNCDQRLINPRDKDPNIKQDKPCCAHASQVPQNTALTGNIIFNGHKSRYDQLISDN